MATDIATLGLKLDGERFIAEGEAVGMTLKKVGQEGEKATSSIGKLSAAQQGAARAARNLAIAEKQRAEEIARIRASNSQAQEIRTQQDARQETAAAAIGGTEKAKAHVQAMEREFKFRMASLKEAQARGLMTPAEAGRRGRAAAVAFNQGVLSQISTVGAAGGFEGAGRGGFTELAGKLKNVDVAGRSAAGGIGRLNLTMASLLSQATATHPAVGQLTQVVGSLAIGSTLMLGVLGGVAALALAWRNLTKDARDLKEAQEEALEALRALQEQQRQEALGPGGVTGEQIDKAEAEAQRLEREIARLKTLPQLGVGARLSDTRSGVLNRIALLEDELADTLSLIDAGGRDVTESVKKADEERTQLAQRAADERLRIAEQEFQRAVTLNNLVIATQVKALDALARREETLEKSRQAQFDAVMERHELEQDMIRETAAVEAKAAKERQKALDEAARAQDARVRTAMQFAAGLGVGVGIPAVTNILTSLFGGGEDAAAKEAARLREENNRVLAENTRALERLRVAGPDPTVAQFGQAGRALDVYFESRRNQPAFGFPDVLGQGPLSFEDSLASAGLSLEDFDRIARSLDFQVFDENGEVISGALLGLGEAFELAAQQAIEFEAAFTRNLDVRRLSALGLDKEAEALRLQIAQEEELADARARGFSEETIAAIESVQAIERVAEARREELRVMEQLQAFQRSLNLGPLSILSPFAQLEEARRRFEEVRTAALGGDAGAGADLPAAARAFLDASRAFNASGPGFAADFMAVQAANDAAIDLFGESLGVQEQQVQELKVVGTTLKDILVEELESNRITRLGFLELKAEIQVLQEDQRDNTEQVRKGDEVVFEGVK